MVTSIEKAQQRVKDLEEKLKTAKALKQKAEARIKAVETKQKTKEENRRKILIGAMMLDQMHKNDATKASVMAKLDGFLTRSDERALFNLTVPGKTA